MRLLTARLPLRTSLVATRFETRQQFSQRQVVLFEQELQGFVRRAAREAFILCVEIFDQLGE